MRLAIFIRSSCLNNIEKFWTETFIFTDRKCASNCLSNLVLTKIISHLRAILYSTYILYKCTTWRLLLLQKKLTMFAWKEDKQEKEIWSVASTATFARKKAGLFVLRVTKSSRSFSRPTVRSYVLMRVPLQTILARDFLASVNFAPRKRTRGKRGRCGRRRNGVSQRRERKKNRDDRRRREELPLK